MLLMGVDEGGFPAMRTYLRLSRSPLYSLVFLLPLVGIYELLALLVNWDTPNQLRNGADVLLRQLLYIFGVSTPYLLGAALAGALGLAWAWQRRRQGISRVEGSVLLAMLGESVVWSGALALALHAAGRMLSLVPSARLIAIDEMVLPTALLAVGAGVYEEAVFRLLSINAFNALFAHVFRWQRRAAWGLAVVVSAVLFSLFHFVGPMGEAFNWAGAIYRGLAGILLGSLYSWRGFGITAYAHSGYDLIVLALQTVR